MVRKGWKGRDGVEERMGRRKGRGGGRDEGRRKGWGGGRDWEETPRRETCRRDRDGEKSGIVMTGRRDSYGVRIDPWCPL